MKYEVPIILVLEVEDDGGNIRLLSREETTKLRKVVMNNLGYLITDMDFLYDSIQERLPGDVCLISIRIKEPNDQEMQKDS